MVWGHFMATSYTKRICQQYASDKKAKYTGEATAYGYYE